ncbi:MAG: hypothetical protein EOP54_02945 [Sphingobacteriales bacterium]|nr:MAG: hypothetical protein EOP54_02945 [Sphingobacteriales bacterium]
MKRMLIVGVLGLMGWSSNGYAQGRHNFEMNCGNKETALNWQGATALLHLKNMINCSKSNRPSRMLLIRQDGMVILMREKQKTSAESLTVPHTGYANIRLITNTSQ